MATTTPPNNERKESAALAYLSYLLQNSMSSAALVAGPMLICVATALISYVMCYGIRNVVPLYGEFLSLPWIVHTSIALFLGTNILFNYAACILTDPGTTGSPSYERLVEEARALGSLPARKEDDEGYLTGVTSSTSASAVVATTTTSDGHLRKRGDLTHSSPSQSPSHHQQQAPVKTSWLDAGPYDWTWCTRTKQPKPPRAHFDSVTKKVVLNMDHFCPWMFRAVGYRNYRYFWLFLLFVWFGCLYSIASELFFWLFFWLFFFVFLSFFFTVCLLLSTVCIVCFVPSLIALFSSDTHTLHKHDETTTNYGHYRATSI